ncbi:MAG: TonB-dependent receptor [Vicinamibacterales bacterium]
MQSRLPRVFFILFLTLQLLAGAASAQTGAALTGRVTDSVSGDALPAVAIQIDELGRQIATGTDGTFTFPAVPPGTYHLSVRTEGFSSRRTEVVVGTTAGTPVEIVVDRELHFQEVISVGPTPRSQFESFQPTSVLAAEDLSRQIESSLGATLDNQLGVASRSFGPAPSRPIIRGLDGDRVLVLQDGQRTGDLSSQSGDHSVTINPAAAQRIEVVRGPATLLYGANAIGGLVNVISDDIPTRPVNGMTGNFLFDLASASREGSGAGNLQVGNGALVFSLGGGGRRTGDFMTPDGEVPNSQSRTGYSKVGLGWTGQRAYAGASYGYDDTRFGIPVVEGGVLRLTPRRHAFTFQTGGRELDGLFDEVRATLAVRRYQHDELEGDEVGTAFTNNTTEVSLLGSHRALGRMKGSIGAWVLDRGFNAVGAEALSPAVDQRGVAAFLYEEVTWPHLTFQFAGRVDNTRFAPAGEPERSFTNGSGSLGLLFRPAAASDRIIVAASLARAARNPALEELFFFGTHHGNFAVELGNPELTSERALGFDLSLRWRSPRVSGEITYFRNGIDNYIYRNVIDEETFEAREEEFEARFPGRELVGHDHAHEGEEIEGEDHDHDHEGEEHEGEEELAIVDFVSADAVLQGFEFHTDLQLSSTLVAEVGADYVHGALTSDDSALPRIPPFRMRGGLRYQTDTVQVGGQIVGAARQDRVSGLERPTDGWTTLRLYASYSFVGGGVLNTITARFDNVADTLYRNHLSLIKDLVPEMGRNVKLVYNVRF